MGGPLSDEFQSQFLDAMNVLEIWDVVGLAGAGSFFSALDAGMIIFAGTNWQLLS